MSDDMISRADAIAILEDEMPGHYLSKKTQIVTKLRALPAVEVGVKPECGHPFCGDKCGTAAPAQDVAGLVRRRAAQTLWDMLHMENGAHEGMTHDEVRELWYSVNDEGGFSAVTTFLARMKKDFPNGI